jgi:hypothetical protein
MGNDEPDDTVFITKAGRRMTADDLDELAEQILNDPATEAAIEAAIKAALTGPRVRPRRGAATYAEPEPDVTDQWLASDTYRRLQARVPKGEAWSGVSIYPHWGPIVADIDAALAELDPNYEIYQVKEKWGQLRYYCSLDDRDDAIAIIRAGETRAAHTCTRCGLEDDTITSGTVTTGTVATGWVATLCPACRDTAGKTFINLRGDDAEL